MRNNPHRRKPINLKVDITPFEIPSKESFWRLRFSDILVILLAGLTAWLAYLTLTLGSTENQQKNEIRKLDSEISELKYIDTLALRQVAAQEVLTSKVSQELLFISMSYRRSSMDSADAYLSDSLQWQNALVEIDRILETVHTYFYSNLEPSFENLSYLERQLYDTINSLRNYFNLSNGRNAFFRTRTNLREAAHYVAKFLADLSEKIPHSDEFNQQQVDQYKMVVSNLADLRQSWQKYLNAMNVVPYALSELQKKLTLYGLPSTKKAKEKNDFHQWPN
jgi:hypothetical protein